MSAPARGVRPTQAARTEATTARLLDAAQALFAQKGFAQTGTEEIVAAAAVTRGALYHHFKNKDALFEAVFQRLQSEIGARIAAAAAAAQPDPRARLVAGCRAFLAAACEPAIGRIVLLDAPVVLGPVAWRLADEENAVFRLRGGLAALKAGCGDETLDVEALTVLVNGALNEAALWIASGTHPDAFPRACDALDRLIATLAPPAAEPPAAARPPSAPG